MTAEWFTDDNRIVETSWGRFQDTPIFRSLARGHNAKVTKQEMIDTIAAGGNYGNGVWVDTDSFGPVTDLDGNVIG